VKKIIVLLLSSLCLLAFSSKQPALSHGGQISPEPDNTRSAGAPPALPDPGDFVNYETAHVHPLDLSPNGNILAAVNTPDGHVELFDTNGPTEELTYRESIRVGIGPVTARFRTDNELWVINQISDSISIIDISTSTVVNTLLTYQLKDVEGVLKGSPNGDEPADVIFAIYNAKETAFVSCSRTDTIQLWDITSTPSYNQDIYLQGEDPRELAIANGNVYATIFESGNSSTLIFGEFATGTVGIDYNTAGINKNNHRDHPYYIDGGSKFGDSSIKSINPAPNDGTVGPFGLDDPLGSYDAHGKSIDVIDLFSTNPGAIPPPTSIIVKKDFLDGDKWKDDNGADWTRYISGDRAAESGRIAGWDMLDNDIAILSLNDLGDTYATRQMNICMAIGVKPYGEDAGNVYMVGTDATNEIRFEPNLTGTFVRVMLSITKPDGTPVRLIDLNKFHLDAAQGGEGLAYSDGSVSPEQRAKSIGDPRGIAFTPDGSNVYISGMGSNNVISIDTSNNARHSVGHTIEVGHGPTGIVHHGTLDRLYVLNKFGASISVIDTKIAGSETVSQTLKFYDPTPGFINVGRVHFYGTHENSGLGQISCASCHIDGRMDRLSWDLGNPAAITDGNNDFPNPVDAFFADIRGFDDGLIVAPKVDPNPNDAINTLLGFQSFISTEASFKKFHPMKGPMTTQTLQDIIGKEPHHWRGDKDGIEEFAGAWTELQGADFVLNETHMQQFEDFLSTIHFPPNPFRLLDNTLPGGPNADGGTNPNLDMAGFYTAPNPGNTSLSAPGTPMEDAVPSGGDAWNGFKLYVDETADSQFRCVDCHTLPMGGGPTQYMDGGLPFSNFKEIPSGANGEAHQMVVSIDGTGQPHFKIPQTRNQIDKDGMYLDHTIDGLGVSPKISRAGFGVLHDGSIDGLVRFLSESAFADINDTGDTPPSGNSSTDDESVADIVAFTLAINGGDFDYLTTLTGAPTGTIPPAANEQEAHAGIGHSITIDTIPAASSAQEVSIYWMTRRASEAKLGLVVAGLHNGDKRGWVYSSGINGSTIFQSDRDGESVGIATLFGYAGTSGSEMTFMVVPTIEETRRGIDRDGDSVYDSNESDINTDFGNPNDHRWVDKNYAGTHNGTRAEPYSNIDNGISVLSPSPGKTSVLHVEAGTYSTEETLDFPMTITAESGTVTID